MNGKACAYILFIPMRNLRSDGHSESQQARAAGLCTQRGHPQGVERVRHCDPFYVPGDHDGQGSKGIEGWWRDPL